MIEVVKDPWVISLEATRREKKIQPINRMKEADRMYTKGERKESFISFVYNS